MPCVPRSAERAASVERPSWSMQACLLRAVGCASEPVPVEEEPCRSLRAVYRRLMGREPGVNRKNAFNDTIRFREAGINAVTFGPGEDGWAVDNENISVTKSVMATRIYALTIMQILGVRA